jgi:toxin ParE1/3/4
MRIRWTVAAADDLQRIHDYLGEHEPHLARSTVTVLREAILSLQRFPNRGRPGAIDGTRELLHERLPCVKEEAFEILHIWYPSQERP